MQRKVKKKILVSANTTSAEKKKPTLCLVATVPMVLHAFMRPHVDALKSCFEITLVCNAVEPEMRSLLFDQVEFFPLGVQRKISPAKDLVSFFSLYKLLCARRFDCVLSIMPKTGLLAMLGGFAAGTPARVHIFTGQVWANKKGLKRYALKLFDKVIAACSTDLLTDSKSQRDFLMAHGVVALRKIQVIADGSICGVDGSRFAPNVEARLRIRANYNIPTGAIVYLYLGRINKDKGVDLLLDAFARVANFLPSAHLFVVGPDEDGFASKFEHLRRCFPGRVHTEGFTQTPESFMRAADVFCLPSYREGFGTVILEAAAVGVPAIASRIYGLTDAVVDGVTGELVPVGDASALAAAMSDLAVDTARRIKMGQAAALRAIDVFSQQRVVTEFKAYMLERVLLHKGDRR